jgi:hypothetical protein
MAEVAQLRRLHSELPLLPPHQIALRMVGAR